MIADPINCTFVLLSPYPTSKAYGVTTKYTFEAVANLGLKTSLLAPNDLNTYSFGVRGRIALAVYSSLKKTFNRSGLVSVVCFYLTAILWLINLRQDPRIKSARIIWSRNLVIPLMLRSKNIIHISEVHQPPSKAILLATKSIKKSDKLIIGVISEYLRAYVRDCNLSRFPIISLPMAVPDFFLKEISNRVLEDSFKFDVGYFGSLQSASQDQGVLRALEQLEIYRLQAPNSKFLFAGVGDDGKIMIETYLRDILDVDNTDAYEVIPHINHDKIPQLLTKCFSLLIPHPEGDFFKAKFPLKALEYASSCRPILCSNTESHKNIFRNGEVFFYEIGDDCALNNLLSAMKGDPQNIAKKTRLAWYLANENTYSARVQKAIDFAMKISTKTRKRSDEV